MKTKTKDRLLTIGALALMSLGGFSTSGCAVMERANLSPLSEYMHVSHAGDGLSGPGFDTLSLGVRWRPLNGVTVDLLEGYSYNKLDNTHEVFTGRVTVEF